MATSRKARYTEADKQRFAEQRQAELDAMHDRLVVGVSSLVDGEQWRAWLRVAAKFRTYSFNNTILLFQQRPDATRVAGYKTWQSLGRQVNKGETGIRIFAPVPRRVDQVKPDGSPVVDAAGRPVRSVEVVGYRLASVFDVSQTSGRELVEPPSPQLLTGQAPAGLWDRLQGLLEDRGFRVERGDCGGANGVTRYDEQLVRVRADVDDAQAVRTLAHEAGHVLLHSPQANQGVAQCRGRVEVEAESVAYLVTAAHGLDAAQYTFTYVAGWAESAQASSPPDTSLADIISSTGSRVIGAADTILAVTNPPQSSAQAPGDDLMVPMERGIQTDH